MDNIKAIYKWIAVYINKKIQKLQDGSSSLRFYACEKVEGKTRTIGYLAGIRASYLTRDSALIEFWRQFEQSCNKLNIDSQALSQSVLTSVPFPKSKKVKLSKPTKQRQDNDLYQTATAVTERFLEMVKVEGTTFEPCVGDGDIANLLPNCTTNDVSPDVKWRRDFTLNAASPEAWEKFGCFDWVITNPPFSAAEQILPLAWENSRVGVAFLLRLSFIEPTQDRGDWLEDHADNLYRFIPVNPRINFRSDTNATDSVTVAWFVWRKDWSWRSHGVESPFAFIRNWR